MASQRTTTRRRYCCEQPGSGTASIANKLQERPTSQSRCSPELQDGNPSDVPEGLQRSPRATDTFTSTKRPTTTPSRRSEAHWRAHTGDTAPVQRSETTRGLPILVRVLHGAGQFHYLRAVYRHSQQLHYKRPYQLGYGRLLAQSDGTRASCSNTCRTTLRVATNCKIEFLGLNMSRHE